MMRFGFDSQMLFDANGQVFAIVLGADFTSEHEWGIDDLVLELTGDHQLQAERTAAEFRKGERTEMPTLLERSRFTRSLEDLVFQTGTDKSGEPMAAVGFHAHGHRLDLLNHPELTGSARADSTPTAGAWDSKSFGFKVRGADRVSALTEFVAAMKAGRCMFVNRVLDPNPQDGERLKGLVICIADKLTQEHLERLAAQQAAFESNVALHLKSRVDEILEAGQRAFSGRARMLGLVHPVWRDGKAGSDILYSLRPGYGNNNATAGIYSFERLMEWLEAGAQTPLTPAA